MSNPNPESSLSDHDIATAAAILAKLKPGFLPFPIFHQICRLTVTSTIELMPMRKRAGKVEILLTERPADDPDWPGQLHAPGTVLRATDYEHTYASAFQRIITEELGAIKLAGPPTYVTTVFHKVNRGVENDTVYYIEVTGEPATGRFYNVEALPETTVSTQLEFIAAAAKLFRAQS